MTLEQQKKVTENMGLVRKVISDKVFGMERYSIYTYDDLFQIGCVGLCKAAVTDKGGCFTTYAYCLIWHEICDALIYANRRRETEIPVEYTEELAEKTVDMDFVENQISLIKMIKSARKEVSSGIGKGIDALIMMSIGYSSLEVGKKMGIAPNLARAWASKARKYLCALPEIRQMAGGI